MQHKSVQYSGKFKILHPKPSNMVTNLSRVNMVNSSDINDFVEVI